MAGETQLIEAGLKAAQGTGPVMGAVQKVKVPSSIAMLFVVLGMFLVVLGLTGGESLKAIATQGTTIGSVEGASGGGSSGAD